MMLALLNVAVLAALTAPVSAQSIPSITWVPGSSVKLEQMIGECDYTVKAATGACAPTTSRTVSRFNILGNDLGSSFEAGGKVIFLFGDTIPGNTVLFHQHDPMAWSTSTNPEGGLLLNFYTNPDGTPLFVIPPGVPTGGDDVPNAGIELSDGIYLVYNSGSQPSLDNPHINDYSVLVKFDPATQTFTTGRTISQMPNGHFIITSLHTSGSDVLMYGLGAYRATDIYLATTPASSFASGVGTRYFAGLVNGQPTWTTLESGAVPVVQDNPQSGPAWPNDSPTVGNVSVVYSAPLKLWLMTYDGGRQTPMTNGFYFAYAQAPWGPWSQPQLIYSANRDPGLGLFIHDPSLPPPGDGLTGPAAGTNDPVTTRGGAYAPYMIERFTTLTGNTLKIYYTLSTWNPYTIVLMRSEFQIASTTGVVVEYFDRDLNNYFITADPTEQAFVDSGAVGRWQRTGNTFAAGGPNQVCRFYGNSSINPSTGLIFGPNSHFYTANPTECAGLKAQYTPTAKSWKFESNDFLTTAAVNGGCPSGLVPVYRAYNNGFARGIDSNHRITSNFAAYQQTVAAGSIGEGIVMCAPSSSAASAPLLLSQDGTTVYDTVNNVRWLADANLAASNRFGLPVCGGPAIDRKACVNASGSMSYQAAASWVNGMNAANYLGHSNWQLPTTPANDSGCGKTGPSGNNFGFGCSAGAYGSLYYNALGLQAPNTAVRIPNSKVGPFSNFQPYLYWSQTSAGQAGYSTFSFNSGFQGANTAPNFLYLLPMIQGKISGTPAAVGNGLQVNPGGQTVYDPVANITWLANANLAATNTFGLPSCMNPTSPALCVNQDGAMTWDAANQLVTNMNTYNGTGYLSQTNWELPPIGPTCTGYNNCASDSSPMAELFYGQLGLSQGAPVVAAPNIDVGPFNNIQPYLYWACAGPAIQGPCQTDGPAPNFEWSFSFGNGFQGTDLLTNDLYVTAYFVGSPTAVSGPVN